MVANKIFHIDENTRNIYKVFFIISLLSSFNTSLFSFEYDDDTPLFMDNFDLLNVSCLPYSLLHRDAAYITVCNFDPLIFILPPLLSYV